jgi:hypothetical protein
VSSRRGTAFTFSTNHRRNHREYFTALGRSVPPDALADSLAAGRPVTVPGWQLPEPVRLFPTYSWVRIEPDGSLAEAE